MALLSDLFGGSAGANPLDQVRNGLLSDLLDKLATGQKVQSVGTENITARMPQPAPDAGPVRELANTPGLSAPAYSAPSMTEGSATTTADRGTVAPRLPAPLVPVTPTAEPSGQRPDFAPSFGQRMGNIAKALQGHDTTDFKQITEAKNQTYDFLTRRGMADADARALIANPQFMAAALPTLFQAKGDWKLEKVGEDENQRAVFAWTNPKTREIQPLGPGGLSATPPGTSTPGVSAPATTPAPVTASTAAAPLGTAAPAADAAPAGGANPYQTPYQTPPAPPGVNPVEFRKEASKKTADEQSKLRDKSLGAIDTIRRVQGVRALLDKPLETPYRDQWGYQYSTYGDVVGPWATPNPAPATGGIAGQVISAAQNVPAYGMQILRNIAGQKSPEVANVNRARNEIETSLSALQGARVKELFGSQNLSDADREAAAKTVGTITAQDAKALKSQMEVGERDSFNNLKMGLDSGVINPNAVPLDVVRRGVELGILDGKQFRGFKGVAPKQAAAPNADQKPDQATAIQQAKAAIAAGKDPAAVRERLRSWGYSLD